MTDRVLVHLAEPADWRAALRVGELRPASLETAGFVHLSTPGRVHLPASRLFRGRRDLVLLVVDPRRLTDPVREEPGVPSDPEGVRFPHLYGPLPAPAVVAVVPYRPPALPVLPDPDDALGRALALYLALPVRRAADVRDVPGGVAVLEPRFRYSRDDNRLLLSSPVDAGTIERAASDVGLPVAAATLCWPGAGRVARELAARGWEVDELVLMARGATPAAGGERAEVVGRDEVRPLWDRSWRRMLHEQVPDGELDEVVRQLVGREERNDRVLAVADVGVREEGSVVAAGQLRVDGATASVESVLTDPAFRGRGHAGAVLARCLTLAADAGCDLVVLEAVADDWPRHWYARAGFAAIGSVWEAWRPR